MSVVVRQFDGYTIDDQIHINGKLVLGESIGDLAGVKIAISVQEITTE